MVPHKPVDNNTGTASQFPVHDIAPEHNHPVSKQDTQIFSHRESETSSYFQFLLTYTKNGRSRWIYHHNESRS
ncbi:hypothetical protein MtrunA17_Chr7g0252541 [Medicago truncatula]|uniref:Uncharacterized protein n=1 Tax=Medicago truncatula TaxID=3880 RepID=A0A396H3M9_MEDTR|nr:hypothetical protein MtrunA17_Chr7g0252541 [Medicago truncatula]